MGADRTDLGFGAELEGFDPADWAPSPTRRAKAAPEERAASRELAEATGFRSREPGRGAATPAPTATSARSTGAAAAPATPATPIPPVTGPGASASEAQADASPSRPQRRRRTGRNAQFNIKARPETIAAFCAVADARGWGLGETLEHAVALLEQAHGAGPDGSQGGQGRG